MVVTPWNSCNAVGGRNGMRCVRFIVGDGSSRVHATVGCGRRGWLWMPRLGVECGRHGSVWSVESIAVGRRTCQLSTTSRTWVPVLYVLEKIKLMLELRDS